MANEKVKNLNITELKKHNKKLDEKEQHTLTVNGESYTVGIDKVFRKTKQFKLVEDFAEFMNRASKDIELFDLATPYITLLFVKHFTTVNVPEEIDGAIELLNVLIDLDLLNQILNLLPESQVKEVYEIISTTADKMNEEIAETVNEIDKIKEQVENGELTIENDVLKKALIKDEQAE